MRDQTVGFSNWYRAALDEYLLPEKEKSVYNIG